MIKTIYTGITGNYDDFHPQQITEGWNYLLFTDKPHKAKWDFRDTILSFPWTVKQVKGSPFMTSREVKILYRKYITADISVYIDGNYEIIGDLNEFLKEIKFSSGIMTGVNPYRRSIREELNQIIKLGKASTKSVNEIRLKMDHIGQTGLSRGGIIVRDKSIPDYYFQKWFDMVKICPRDQASLNWVFRDKVKMFPDRIRSKYFKRHKHENQK